MEDKNFKEYYTVDEIHQISGRHPRTFQNACSNGILPSAKKIKNIWHIHIDDIKRAYPDIFSRMELELYIENIEKFVKQNADFIVQSIEDNKKIQNELKEKGEDLYWAAYYGAKLGGKLEGYMDVLKQIKAKRPPGWD